MREKLPNSDIYLLEIYSLGAYFNPSVINSRAAVFKSVSLSVGLTRTEYNTSLNSVKIYTRHGIHFVRHKFEIEMHLASKIYGQLLARTPDEVVRIYRNRWNLFLQGDTRGERMEAKIDICIGEKREGRNAESVCRKCEIFLAPPKFWHHQKFGMPKKMRKTRPNIEVRIALGEKTTPMSFNFYSIFFEIPCPFRFNGTFIWIRRTFFSGRRGKRQRPSRDRSALFDVVKSWPRFRRTFCTTRIRRDEKRCAPGWPNKIALIVLSGSNRWTACLQPTQWAFLLSRAKRYQSLNVSIFFRETPTKWYH